MLRPKQWLKEYEMLLAIEMLYKMEFGPDEFSIKDLNWEDIDPLY